MAHSYVIETRNGAAGIVVRDGPHFRFFAATPAFGCLEGRLFLTPKAAEAAVRRHAGGAAAGRPRRDIAVAHAPGAAPVGR